MLTLNASVSVPTGFVTTAWDAACDALRDELTG